MSFPMSFGTDRTNGTDRRVVGEWSRGVRMGTTVRQAAAQVPHLPHRQVRRFERRGSRGRAWNEPTMYVINRDLAHCESPSRIRPAGGSLSLKRKRRCGGTRGTNLPFAHRRIESDMAPQPIVVLYVKRIFNPTIRLVLSGNGRSGQTDQDMPYMTWPCLKSDTTAR